MKVTKTSRDLRRVLKCSKPNTRKCPTEKTHRKAEQIATQNNLSSPTSSGASLVPSLTAFLPNHKDQTHRGNLASHSYQINEETTPPKVDQMTVSRSQFTSSPTGIDSSAFKETKLSATHSGHFEKAVEGNSSSRVCPDGLARFSCPSCDVSCLHKESLKRHIANFHSLKGKTPYSCQTCSFSSIHKHSVKRHVNRFHSTENRKANDDESVVHSKTSTTPSSLKNARRFRTKRYNPIITQELVIPIQNNTTSCGNKKLNSHVGYDNTDFNQVGTSPQRITSTQLTDKLLTSVPAKSNAKNKLRFYCEICDYSTIYKWNLKLHSRVHLKKLPIICTICGCSFQSQNYLQKHERLHIPLKAFDREQLLSEMTRGHSGKPFPCLICLSKFSSRKKLEKHSEMHPKLKPLEAPSTTLKGEMNRKSIREIPTAKRLKNNGKASPPLKKKTGDSIAFPFSDPTSVSVAIPGHTRTRMDPLDLDHSFVKPSNEDSEIDCSATARKCRKRAFSCHICNEVFSSMSLISTHFKTHDSNRARRQQDGRQRSFQCDICEIPYATKQTLKKHVTLHFQPLYQRKKYSCDNCELSFTSKWHLKRHEKKHFESANQRRKYPCDKCERSFTENGNLKKHEKIHFGSVNQRRKYPCDKCEISFTENGNLKKHEKLHFVSVNKRRKYPCDKCEWSFTEKAHLKRHDKIHLEPLDQRRKYSCNKCHRSFTEKWNLKKHVTVRGCFRFGRAEEKPYFCHLCGTGYSSLYFLQKHWRERHSTSLRKSHPKKSNTNQDRTNFSSTSSSTVKKFSCPFCKSQFTRNFNLSLHISRKHHQEVTRRKTEELTNIASTNSSNQHNHELNKFKCTRCTSTFAVENILQKHLQRSHGNKTHTCVYCDVSFRRRDVMRRHQAQHLRNTKDFRITISDGSEKVLNDVIEDISTKEAVTPVTSQPAVVECTVQCMDDDLKHCNRGRGVIKENAERRDSGLLVLPEVEEDATNILSMNYEWETCSDGSILEGFDEYGLDCNFSVDLDDLLRDISFDETAFNIHENETPIKDGVNSSVVIQTQNNQGGKPNDATNNNDTAKYPNPETKEYDRGNIEDAVPPEPIITDVRKRPQRKRKTWISYEEISDPEENFPNCFSRETELAPTPKAASSFGLQDCFVLIRRLPTYCPPITSARFIETILENEKPIVRN